MCAAEIRRLADDGAEVGRQQKNQSINGEVVYCCGGVLPLLNFQNESFNSNTDSELIECRLLYGGLAYWLAPYIISRGWEVFQMAKCGGKGKGSGKGKGK